MASGTIYGTTSDAYTQIQVEWEANYNRKTQESRFYCDVRLKRSKSAPTSITYKGNLKIRYYTITLIINREYTIPNNDEWVTLALGLSDFLITKETEFNIRGDSAYFNVEENGVAKQITYSISGTGLMDILDDQAATNSVVVSGSGTLSDEIIVEYTPVADTYDRFVCFIRKTDYTHVASYSEKLGKTETSIQQHKIILPSDVKERIYKGIVDSNQCVLDIRIESYVDDKYETAAVGDYQQNQIRVRGVIFPADDMTMPTAELVCEPISSLEEPLSKLYWPGSSKIKADLINYAGKYGAEVVSRKITIISQGGDAPFTSNVIEGTNPVTVRGTLTDTRGISRTYEQVITPVAYGTPQLRPYGDNEKIIVARCDTEGVENENGTSFVIAARRNYSNISYDGSQINFCRVDYRIKELGGAFGEWKTILEGEDTSDQIRIVPADEKGLLAIEKTYIVQLRAIDSLENSIELSFTLSSDKVYMHRSGRRNSIAFGGYITGDNSFEVYQEGVFHGGLIVEPLDGFGGIVLRSASGKNQFVISVNDDGALSVTPVNATQTFLLRREE